MTESEYYKSHEKLSFIGPSGQQKISLAKVLVIGAGGLGCPCLLLLTGCGVGTIGIADFDTISASNLHRQVIYNSHDIGKLKTSIAIERLSSQNPYITFKEHPAQVTENNVLSLIRDYDIVVDGTDNFLVRYLINDACVFLNKPLVYGAIHQTEGHISVFNYNNSPGLRSLFPEPSPEEFIPNCAETGAYNISTGMVGSMMANETIKIILNNPDVSSGKLVCLDVMNGKINHFSYAEKPGDRKTSESRFANAKESPDLPAEKLFEKIKDKSFHLIDVREKEERNQVNIGGKHIPLSGFAGHSFTEFISSDILIVYCEKGIRSLNAANQLRKKGFYNTFSLAGGINSWKDVQRLLKIPDIEHTMNNKPDNA